MCSVVFGGLYSARSSSLLWLCKHFDNVSSQDWDSPACRVRLARAACPWALRCQTAGPVRTLCHLAAGFAALFAAAAGGCFRKLVLRTRPDSAQLQSSSNGLSEICEGLFQQNSSGTLSITSNKHVRRCAGKGPSGSNTQLRLHGRASALPNIHKG